MLLHGFTTLFSPNVTYHHITKNDGYHVIGFKLINNICQFIFSTHAFSNETIKAQKNPIMLPYTRWSDKDKKPTVSQSKATLLGRGAHLTIIGLWIALHLKYRRISYEVLTIVAALKLVSNFFNLNNSLFEVRHPDEPDYEGITSLMKALDEKKGDIVSKLLEIPQINLNFQDKKSKRSAIFYAILNAPEKTLKTILDLKCSLEIIDIKKRNPPMFAAKQGATNAFLKIIDSGLDFDINAQDENKNTLLHLVVENMPEQISKVLGKKPNLFLENLKSETPLMIAARSNPSFFIPLLIAYLKQDHSESYIDKGLEALQKYHPEYLPTVLLDKLENQTLSDELKKKYCDIQDKRFKNTPLISLAKNGKPNQVKDFVSKYPNLNLNKTNAQGNNAFMEALIYNPDRFEITQFLIQQNIDLTLVNIKGRDVFMEAMLKSTQAAILILYKIKPQDDQLIKYTLFAVEHNEEVARYLLQLNPDINKEIDGASIIVKCAQFDFSLFELLFITCSNIDSSQLSKAIQNLLKAHTEKIPNMLLHSNFYKAILPTQKQAMLNTKDLNGNTYLMLLAKTVSVEQIETFLKENASYIDLNNVNNDGDNIAMIAMKHNLHRKGIALFCLEQQKFNYLQKNSDGNDLFKLSMMHEHSIAFLILEKHKHNLITLGTNGKFEDRKNQNDDTDLHIAAQYHPEIAAHLLDFFSSIDSFNKSKKQETPLTLAAHYNPQIVTKLLEKAQRKFAQALTYSTQNGHLEASLALIKKGVSEDERIEAFLATPLLEDFDSIDPKLGFKREYETTAKHLLNLGKIADETAIKFENMTALMFACLYHKAMVVEETIKKIKTTFKDSTNLKNYLNKQESTKQYAAIHFAARFNPAVVKTFIENTTPDLDLTKIEKNYYTATMLCAYIGADEAFTFLNDQTRCPLDDSGKKTVYEQIKNLNDQKKAPNIQSSSFKANYNQIKSIGNLQKTIREWFKIKFWSAPAIPFTTKSMVDNV